MPDAGEVAAGGDIFGFGAAEVEVFSGVIPVQDLKGKGADGRVEVDAEEMVVVVSIHGVARHHIMLLATHVVAQFQYQLDFMAAGHEMVAGYADMRVGFAKCTGIHFLFITSRPDSYRDKMQTEVAAIDAHGL